MATIWLLRRHQAARHWTCTNPNSTIRITPWLRTEPIVASQWKQRISVHKPFLLESSTRGRGSLRPWIRTRRHQLRLNLFDRLCRKDKMDLSDDKWSSQWQRETAPFGSGVSGDHHHFLRVKHWIGSILLFASPRRFTSIAPRDQHAGSPVVLRRQRRLVTRHHSRISTRPTKSSCMSTSSMPRSILGTWFRQHLAW